ncbi:Receptor-type tyrosine-protein phosphatase alpha, partial [Calypte anna]
MDLWVFLLLLGSGLISVGASNVTTGPPTTVPTSPRSPTKAPTAGPEDGTPTRANSLNVSTPVTAPTMASQPPTTTATRLSPNASTLSINTSTLGTTIPMAPATSLLPSVTPAAPHTALPTTEPEVTQRNFSATVTTQETSSASHNDETPIIAVMVALSSLLVIVFIIIVLYMLRFKKYKQAGSHSNSFRLSNGRTDDAEPQSMPLLARSPSTNRKYPPLPVDKLEEEINRRMADDNKLFREEFNALPACPIQATCEAASKEENKEKNRYVNILPYDHSRVHLTPVEGVPDSDYINASFINGYQEKNKFIAAQGPKEETVNDFWRMIWEQNTATIVMVTNLKERKECKCAQYWPDQGCWTYGNIRVSVEDVTVLVDYTVRKFCIQQVGDVTNKKPQRLVTQFHFTSWPDFGVPFTPIGMLKFLKKVKTCNPQYAGAIVVHC